MTPTLSNDGSRTTGTPRMVRRIGVSMVGLLLAGAVYLIAVRGEAIVVDLATLGGKVWCF